MKKDISWEKIAVKPSDSAKAIVAVKQFVYDLTK